MEQNSRYKGLQDDLRSECLKNCGVPGGCNQTDDRCGIRRGIKYGLYPQSALNGVESAVPRSVRMQISHGVGAKDKPLWRLGDGMIKFCTSVSAYSEPWLDRERAVYRRAGI